MAKVRVARAVAVVGTLCGMACGTTAVTPLVGSDAGDAAVDSGADGPIESRDEGGDVSTTTWCTGRTEKFCWDFDRGAYDEAFTSRGEQSGFVSQATDASANSPPKAMLATLLPIASPSGVWRAVLERGTAPLAKAPTTTIALDFKLLAYAGADAGATPVVGISSTFHSQSPTKCLATITFNGSSLRLFVLGGFFTFGSPPPLNTWIRIQYSITWDVAGKGAATVSVDGNEVFAKTALTTCDITPTGGFAQNAIGLWTTTAPAGEKTIAAFDNVTFDY